MIRADIYTAIEDRHDSAAVGRAFLSIIAGVQSAGITPAERDSLITSIIADLADENITSTSSNSPVWRSWDEETYEAALECVKVLSRSQAGSSSLSTPASIQILLFHAKGQTKKATALTGGCKSQQSAVSAVCNTLLLHQNAPELYAKAGYGDWAIKQLDETDASTENERMWSFLMGRVVMILTSRATYGFLGKMVDELEGLRILKRKLMEVAQSPLVTYPAVAEYMKILYHVFALYPETQGREWDHRFNELASPVTDALLAFPKAELTSPFSNMINVLTRFSPIVLREIVQPSSRLLEGASKIFDATRLFFERTLPPPPWKPGDVAPSEQYESQLLESLDEVLPPPLLVLVNLINSSKAVKQRLKQRIIPSDLDRSPASLPLEERPDVLGHLLRLSRSAVNHVTAGAAGELLWALCNEDDVEMIIASVLTEEIGYGNAAGILFNKGIPVPPARGAKIEEIPEDNAEPNVAEPDFSRNPITGLYQPENISLDPIADMTEEEKEQEAEKMMALFDRMARNPTMQLVENPLKDAVRTGKIDEFEKLERDKELQELLKQEQEDEAEAEKEISDWKKRMGKAT
ncbi:hypothetical protein QFC19_008062 [Naganishia cerealis]|uniref:Uncharacterized protein n=1 Tax=Naganishia cerealis TaxID=610337 RepID=A0ACC2V5B7_9TREE|nr:hypothetical protein QFC19_008062 [Naganishia cerealis]